MTVSGHAGAIVVADDADDASAPTASASASAMLGFDFEVVAGHRLAFRCGCQTLAAGRSPGTGRGGAGPADAVRDEARAVAEGDR